MIRQTERRGLRRGLQLGRMLALLWLFSACTARPTGEAPSDATTPRPPALTVVARTSTAEATPALTALPATIAPEVTPLPTPVITAPAPIPSPAPTALPRDTAVVVPHGYRAERYAQGLSQPTALAFGPDGRLYVAQLSGEIVVLDRPGTPPQRYISGLERPLGLVWRNADLYVMSQGTLSVFPNSGATAGKRRDLLTGIPTAGMQNNNLVLGADDWLYVGIGSVESRYVVPSIRTRSRDCVIDVCKRAGHERGRISVRLCIERIPRHAVYDQFHALPDSRTGLSLAHDAL